LHVFSPNTSHQGKPDHAEVKSHSWPRCVFVKGGVGLDTSPIHVGPPVNLASPLEAWIVCPRCTSAPAQLPSLARRLKIVRRRAADPTPHLRIVGSSIVPALSAPHPRQCLLRVGVKKLSKFVNFGATYGDLVGLVLLLTPPLIACFTQYK